MIIEAFFVKEGETIRRWNTVTKLRSKDSLTKAIRLATPFTNLFPMVRVTHNGETIWRYFR